MSDACYIGVDVGGTKVSIGVLEDGELGEPTLMSTDKASSQALVDQLAAGIDSVLTPGTAAVGLGVPSAIEWATGAARSGVNVPLEGVPLRQLLSERLGLAVFVDNDANVAALAEASEGGRVVVDNLVMFTLGTGVGGGLVLGGRPFRGATGAAAEMGHMLIGLDLSRGVPRPAERFPQPGSLERLAAGTALDRLAEASARERPDSPLGRLAQDGREVTGVDVVREAKAGDAEARRLLEVLGGRLGVAIATAINIFDPDEVVIGGGVATAEDLLLEPARAVAAGYVLHGVGERTEIRLARRGVKAGVYGAALLAAQESQRADAPASAGDG